MKKHMTVALTLILTLLWSVSALAGSVPEDMLGSDKAQVFFARLVSYEAVSDGQTKANLIPTKVIKGDVKADKSLWYNDLLKCGDFPLEMNAEYLFLYYDEINPTYFFKTTTAETANLKLIGTDGDMWKRLEKYLNDGKFEEAESKRTEKTSHKPLARAQKSSKAFPYAAFALFGFALICTGAVFIFIKKKKIKSFFKR